MLNREFPILEFDPNPVAVINPDMVAKRLDDMPERCVLCFFAEAIKNLLERYEHRVIGYFTAESLKLPVYEVSYEGHKIALIQAGVGAPVAGSQIDELAAMGATKFFVCGSCGVLQQEIAIGHLIIPDCAVRDEGTSYHYAAPAREISADPGVIECIGRVLDRNNLPHITAKTWTTDAFYRETPEKVALRKSEGCVVVEMEAATYLAVAKFRGVTLGQVLYAGDNLGGAEWDRRDYSNRSDIRTMLLDVAMEICLEM